MAHNMGRRGRTGGEASRSGRGLGLRARVLLLVVLTLVPAAALIAMTAAEQRARASAEMERRALEVARGVAEDERRALDETGEILRLLALAADAEFEDPVRCRTLMRGVVEAYPRYQNVGVIGPDGMYVCGALTPDRPVYLGDRKYFRVAVATREMAVGEPQVGRLTGSPSINLGLPILDEEGRIRRVLYAALKLEWLAEWLDVGALPEDTSVTLLDEQGRVIIRMPDGDLWFGRSLAALSWVDPIVSRRSELVEGEGPGGDRRIFAGAEVSRGVEEASAFVVVGVSLEAICDATRGLGLPGSVGCRQGIVGSGRRGAGERGWAVGARRVWGRGLRQARFETQRHA